VRIKALTIDGFGVWSGLKLEGLSDELNVFFGPNEAGKTTLMQFVRSVLYGYAPQRRRYFPPRCGGRPGGCLVLTGPDGRVRMSRHLKGLDPAEPDEVVVTASDGTSQGEQALRPLLGDVDEALFNNVFAVGLEELQALGALDDTEAASLLYRLSAGIDRVSLVDVVREVTVSRNRLLSPHDEPCQIGQLLAERERLRRELDDLAELTGRYARLVSQRDQFEREACRLQGEVDELQHQGRSLEIAAAVQDRWRRRGELDAQLGALGPVDTLPLGIVEQLDALTSSLAKRRDRVQGFKRRFEQIRAEAAGLKVNENLWRLAPRIEALQEQESWIGSLKNRVAELEGEITELESQLSAERNRFGLRQERGEKPLSAISRRALAALREPAKAVRLARQRQEEAEHEALAARESADALAQQVKAGLEARGEHDLERAVDRVGALVAQLRRRVQIDERLDEMDQYQEELEEQSRLLLERQMLPLGVLLGIGGVFVAGAILVLAGLAGLILPQTLVGAFRGHLMLLGMLCVGVAVAAKFVAEQSNARRLESCHKQIGMLQLQIKETQRERETLDDQLASGDGPVAARLKSAEAKLADLEELVPLDARCKAAEQEALAAEAGLREAEIECETARRRWQTALANLGLPAKLSPKQVKQLASRSEDVRQLHRQLENRYEEYEQRRHELDSLTTRIARLIAEVGVHVEAPDPIDQVRALASHLGEQEHRLKRRHELRREARKLRRKRRKHVVAARRLKRRRRELLRRADARDERELRHRAAQASRVDALRRERDAIQREIDAAIAGHCAEDEIGRLLDSDRTESIEARYDHLAKRLAVAGAKLEERFEKRGQLNEQLRVLADDRCLAGKRLDLAAVEQRIDEALHRWRVLAVTSRALESIRSTYERDRQPETLQEAGKHLGRLTQGRYVRVWTPLDRDVLFVDQAGGEPLPVDLLSRGTREQLFLALRLALAGSYARRGVELPLMLDDVLVNFDVERARAAVAVLRDFAEAGHQVFVFTCHEHIAKLFASAHLEINHLPGSYAVEANPSMARKKRSKRRRKPQPEPAPTPRELVVASTDGDPQDPPEAIDDSLETTFDERRFDDERADAVAADSPVCETPPDEALAETPPEDFDDALFDPVAGEFAPWEEVPTDDAPAESQATIAPGFLSYDQQEDEQDDDPVDDEPDETADEPDDEAENGSRTDPGGLRRGDHDYFDDQGSYDDHGIEIRDWNDWTVSDPEHHWANEDAPYEDDDDYDDLDEAA